MFAPSSHYIDSLSSSSSTRTSLQGMPNNINARLMAAAGKCFGETDKRQQINNNNSLERDAGNWNWNRVQCAISP